MSSRYTYIGYSAVSMSLPKVYILIVRFVLNLFFVFFSLWYRKGKANKVKNKMYHIYKLKGKDPCLALVSEDCLG